jgi:phospholipase/lecithinase/hemolysin
MRETIVIGKMLLGLGTALQLTMASYGACAASSKTSFTTIYAFGDSLSDAGNDYIASYGLIPTPLIYSRGRFSNGNVWVQNLASKLGLGTLKPSLNGGHDFAYGGAETGQDPLHTVNPTDLPSQLAQFLLNEPHPSAGALYTLSIGANDLLDAIPEYASNEAEALADVKAAVANEVTFVSALAADGAKNFLIMNVPDLGKTPEEAGDAATASYLTSLYNTQLKSALGTLAAADNINIYVLDAYTLIDDGVADPAKYGLKNVTTPVWTGNYEDPLSGTLNAYGKAQDLYLFFDHLHPTETGHKILEKAGVATLKKPL